MDWKRGPPVLVGEKVLWSGNGYDRPECGVIKWIGSIPEISSDWCVGIELDVALSGLGADGFWKERKLFECRSKHGLLVPIEKIQKLSSKPHPRSISNENYPHLKLDDTQFRDFAHADHLYKPQKVIKKNQVKYLYSNSESKPIEESSNSQSPNSDLDSKKGSRRSAKEALGGINIDRQLLKIKNQDVVKSPQRVTTEIRNSRFSEPQFSREYESQKQSKTLKSFTKPEVNETSRDSQTFDSEAYINELIRNMNEVAGFFKEIKDGDERFEKQEPPNNLVLYDNTQPGHLKPKKLFSFLKWFNKKHKPEPNLKLFKESSATSSPIFPRRETSSCESIDTLFSTQTVRSFAYIPPTQYKPSAPPLDYDKCYNENDSEDFSPQKNAPEETDSLYEKRKKRRAPQPPRLSRENSLPTTLQRQRSEDFDGITTFHRRTVSESFKDKKAGSYCHVQGKKKAPPPPAAPLYPNLQKVNNQYPSLHKKKKPAPPPPESNSENQNQTKKDVQKQKETSEAFDEPKKEKPKDLKDNGNEQKEERGVKINKVPKDRLTKDASLSPLPSRPWYKRSHRDSTGSNIIRKDLLKGFEKKKNKETDDWMPEVGFPRRSLSTESHSKFNIFSKLEKTEDKKKEEKRKSQISILTNISELDREAAEIVRKEQAQEKKIIAANDAKYYSSKEVKEKTQRPDVMSATAMKNFKASSPKHKSRNSKPEAKLNSQLIEGIGLPQTSVDNAITEEVKTRKDQATVDENLKSKGEISKDKKNNSNSDTQSNDNQKNLCFPNVLAVLSSSSSQPSPEKISKPNQNHSQARLNFFNVQNKELNYLNEPWVCQKCTLENPGWRVFCEICSSIKPIFSSNIASPKTNTTASKEQVRAESVSSKTSTDKIQEAVKTESATAKTDKRNELKLSEGEVKQTTNSITQFSEDEKVTKVETLDELRKKRMTFFSLKLDSSEPERIEPSSSDFSMEPKKILTETKEFLSRNIAGGGNNNVEIGKKPKESTEGQIKRKPKEGTNTAQIKGEEKKSTEEQKNKENCLVVQGNASNSIVVDEGKEERKEKGQESDKYKKKPETSLALVEHNKKDDPNTDKVIEAYIVTKTIVLEDVIVKKPEKGRKVTASVQTKSRLSPGPETKAMRPPPRTKKISFGTSSQDNGTEPELHSENDKQRNVKNYKEEVLEELTSKLTQAEGLADFRAKIQTMPLNTEMNIVVVNRLLQKLETAINCGNHFEAAGFARELALMKINCSVTRQVSASPGTSKITIDLYIEDKVSHQGPIALEVSPTMSLLQLKKKIHQEFGIPLEVQRWILGKKLATDDNKTLESEGVKSDYCPLFLYLVAPDNRKTDKESSKKAEKNTEMKPTQAPQPTESAGPKTKGWYYNYEEDHYSYCEDSEDDLRSSSTELNAKGKEITVAVENTVEVPAATNSEVEQGVKRTEKLPVFDLKSRDFENDAEKELKFISVNFVKQKVEKLNKTFAENTRAVKLPIRSSRSPETWKCGTCNIVNLPGRSNCFSCNAKKLITGPNNTKITNGNGEQLKKEAIKAPARADDNIHYKALIELQDADLVPNSEPFSCSICLLDYNAGEGVTLKDCLHTFCRTCLVGTVEFSEDAEVKCPYSDDTYSCPSVLQQREIKALVPRGIFELHLAKSVKEAENKIGNAFHCKTPDCKGWCIYEDNVNEFRCPVCKSTNCLTCQAIHNGINCREYQERMRDASETDIDAKKTRDMLNEMVEKGEAMACPKCQVVLMKKWGCDWLKCSMCKTEICWVTRGFRWGPEGKGDTSGGCKCGVNGVKCHPKCNYCH